MCYICTAVFMRVFIFGHTFLIAKCPITIIISSFLKLFKPHNYQGLTFFILSLGSIISDLSQVWPISLCYFLIQVSKKPDMSTIFKASNSFTIFIFFSLTLVFVCNSYQEAKSEIHDIHFSVYKQDVQQLDTCYGLNYDRYWNSHVRT